MNTLELTFLKALSLSSLGETDEARLIAEEMLNKHPGYGKAHYLLGWISYENSKNLNEAAFHAREAIKKDPEYPLGYYLYCDILLESKKPEELKLLIDGAIKMQGVDKAYLYHKLACAYEYMDQFQEAMAYMRQSQILGNSTNWSDFIGHEIIRIRRKIGHLSKINTILA